MQLPRGAPAALTTTQVIARPSQGWIAAIVIAILAVASALTVVALTRSGPEPDDGPPVVRMNPVAAPTVTPIDPSAAPATAGSGTQPSGAPAAPATPPIGDR